MMSMTSSFTAMDWIVLVAVIFAAAFSVAWMCSPSLRSGVERPKYRFLADVENYDREPR